MRQSRFFLQLEPLDERALPSILISDTPDRVILAFRDPGVPDDQQVTRLQSLPMTASVISMGDGFFRIELNEQSHLDSALSLFRAMPDVAAAEPDRIVQTQATLNDPRLAEQTALTTIGATSAWNRTLGTRQTVVAVIDTGIDYTHPDLSPNLWINTREVPGNGIDDDGNGYADDLIGYDFAANDPDPSDHDGHGTHVAGIIGAAGNNGIGTAGVNPNTRIMALKFIGTDGNGYTSDAIRALNYAVANGANIVNASWGSHVYDSVFATAIARAQGRGVILVTSAGNDSANNDVFPFYPASYATTLENVVSVAATDANGALAGFSNFGVTSVTTSAPGTNILSTLPGNRYGALSGTSMAAPIVSGALSLLWDANPTWNWQQVVTKLKTSVDLNASLSGIVATAGRINLARMLDVPVNPPPPVAPPPASPPPASPPTPVKRETQGAQVLSAIFHGSTSDQFDRVRVVFNEKINAGAFTVADVTLTGPNGVINATNVVPVSGTNATQFDVIFAAQRAPGDYQITLGVDIFDIAANRMDQNGNGINGEAGDRFSMTARLGQDVIPATPATALPLAIPDSGILRVPLEVTSDGMISNLQLTISIEHQRIGDLILRLRSPDGRTITLVERRGGAADHYSETTFSDAATKLISKGTAPYSGAFRPEESLSGFHGKPARGTWILEIQDTNSGNTGSITEARLEISTTNILTDTVRTLAFSTGESNSIATIEPLTELVVEEPPPINLNQFLAWILETSRMVNGFESSFR